jgi:homoserine O-acetyltransferase
MEKGEYTAQPKVGLSGAIGQLMFMVSSPLQWQKISTRRSREMLDKLVERYLSIMDANDMIYAFRRGFITCSTSCKNKSAFVSC